MRRYVDLINQRQIIALLRNEAPPTRESNSLLIAMSNFEAAYGIYGEFQRQWNAIGVCAGYCRKRFRPFMRRSLKKIW